MRNYIFVIASFLFFAIILSSCSSTGINKETTLKVPSNTTLGKVKPGMSIEQVGKILGEPTDQVVAPTWKEYIPIYNLLGYGTMMTINYYKGIGEIQFASSDDSKEGYFVEYIKYDPNESGNAIIK
ncbi:MAG: outer membrane protein assembly factor BamE [bacterium]|nr:outer membrane protein assembly factor BamE [bacterium]